MTLATTLLAFIVALGLLIVVHELGHYMVARWCGVKVLRFSVGFGTPLWLRRFGPDQTEWVVAAFPMGGFVKMLDEREGEVAPHERERAFNRQSVYRRFAIVLAGPLANFLLAIAVYWLLFMHGVPGFKPILGAPPPATAAAQAQIAAGETILRVDDQEVRTWQDVRWALLERAVERQTVTLEVQNEKAEIAFRKLDLSGIEAADLDGDFLAKIGLTRLPPPPVVGEVTAGKPGEKAGLKPGDRILAVDGKPLATWDDLVAAVAPKGGAPLTLQLRRGADELTVQVTPETVQQDGKSIGRIWVAPDRAALERQMVEVRYGPLAALGQGAVRTWEVSILSLRMLGRMIVGHVSLKNLSGPITIADYAGQSARMGWVAYASFVALISISLGVLNLLPVPLLDGGHLMYYFIEIIKGRPVSERTLEIGQRIGMVVLFTLMAFALFNDIHRLVGG
ncbi:MAG TPA: RIP metalloprotease RseP [Burkholderiales bacterium]|nr:RIP metalloprotease RseP [Burkholderiales bacterium]